MIEQHHRDEARRLTLQQYPEHSEAFRGGASYALAWCLAGRPRPTRQESRATACTYAPGTAEHDAWQSGWRVAYEAAVKARLVSEPGVIHALALSDGSHVEVREPELGNYAWQRLAATGLTQGEGYASPALALVAALDAAATRH